VRWSALFFWGSGLFAQTPLTLSQALEKARTYAGIQVSQSSVDAAKARVAVQEKTAFLPKVEGSAHLNQATANNVAGLLFPSAILAPISGPALLSNSLRPVWGSQLGISAVWEPFDFGQRRTLIGLSNADVKIANAEHQANQFQVQIATADAFLSLLAAQQQIGILQAAETRAEALLKVTQGLTSAGLRPGVDKVRAQAELSLAQSQLALAQGNVDAARLQLQLLTSVVNPQPVEGTLLQEPVPTSVGVDAHPEVLAVTERIRKSDQEQRLLGLSYRPKFLLEGVTFARGTGAQPDGQRLGWLNGVGPNIQNWAIGFTAKWSLLDFKIIREKQAVETRIKQQQQALLQEKSLVLETRRNQSSSQLEAAKKAARLVPQQLEAAQAAVQQANARYQSGLSGISDLIEAQRLLAQIEVEASLANLRIWRAWLQGAAAEGNLDAFAAAAGGSR
jgi:outer membrane protein